MEKENKSPIRWVWQCEYEDCKDIVISYSNIRHDMNYCECGKSAVDLEEGYCREMGKVNVLSIKELTEKGWKTIKDYGQNTK